MIRLSLTPADTHFLPLGLLSILPLWSFLSPCPNVEVLNRKWTFAEHLLSGRDWTWGRIYIISLNSPSSLCGDVYYSPHFTEEDIEVHRGEII